MHLAELQLACADGGAGGGLIVGMLASLQAKRVCMLIARTPEQVLHFVSLIPFVDDWTLFQNSDE